MKKMPEIHIKNTFSSNVAKSQLVKCSTSFYKHGCIEEETTLFGRHV